MVHQSIYNVIHSGSSGNCEIAFNSIVIDIGVPFNAIKPYLHDIQLILLGHVHSDHFNFATLQRIVLERPGIRIACGEWMVEHLPGIKNIDILEIGKWYNYGSFKIAIGRLYHEVSNCFFRIEKNGYKIFRATDTFTLEGIVAKNYNLYAIEFNYDSDTVWDTIREQEEIGQFAHQRRSLNSHLSWQQAQDFIFNNASGDYEVVRLHESKSL
jgi:hypothetical protein